MSDILHFVGDGTRRTASVYVGAYGRPEPYVAASSLIDAVNMALELRRPLLLEGDPGCGKTRLAYAIAYELGYPIKECYIRSTSKARDLLYTYDALGRLYNVQIAAAQRSKIDFQPEKYVTPSSLGEAIQLSMQDTPSIVLIDEIDKAEFDFPNDLLQLLEQLRFRVDEAPALEYDALKGMTREERRDVLPLFIITSNRERELPKPFLRRCLYYYIDFPQQEALKHIITRHFSQGITPLFLTAIKKFWALRDADFSWRKPPSTSELLDWLQVLEIAERQGRMTVAQLEQATLPHLPFLETLVKTQSDRIALSMDEPQVEMVDSADVD